MEKLVSNKEIADWIDNDEGLYNWFNRSRMSKAKFIKENKQELSDCINRVLNGSKPAHFLAYGR